MKHVLFICGRNRRRSSNMPPLLDPIMLHPMDNFAPALTSE